MEGETVFEQSMPPADVFGGQAEEAVEVEEKQVPRLYLVRLARPTTDATDAASKAAQAEFQAHLDRIKKLNAKLAEKRADVRALREQMTLARGLKDTSKPEFEDKSERIRALKTMRNQHQDKIKGIKDLLKGLKCRSEEELDNKIKELEHRMHYDQLPLREEKQCVRDISELQGQRAQVKEYDLHKNEVAELEAECNKIRAVINEMEGEFNILKGERGAASKIMQDLYAKLQVADKVLKEVQEEQAEAVAAKDEAAKARDKAREGSDDTMKDFRENRNFSLKVRDLVAAGQVDEAHSLCAQQTEELIARIATDAAFRKEYYKVAAQQRKFAVSEVLLESSVTAMAEAAERAKVAAKAPKGSAKAAEPQGKQKAEALIASLMQAASKEAEVKRRQVAAMKPAEPEEEEEDVTLVPEAAAKPVRLEPKVPPKPVENPSAKAAEVFGYKVELPKEPDFEYVPPAAKEAPLKESKDQVRAEQRAKAQEAELRKQRRTELAEKKKAKAQLVAEIKKKEEEKTNAASAAAQAKVVTRSAPEPEEVEDEAAASSTQQQSVQQQSSNKPAAKANPVVKAAKPSAAAKRRPEKSSLDTKVKKAFAQNQTAIAVLISILAIIIICILIAKM